jgi:protein-disulfide isomerase
MFSDFQCPFCARVAPTVDEILRRHPNDVRVVWRNYPLPFHQDAELAAEAAMEIFEQRGDAGFWAFHDLLFANQRALERGDLERYAQSVGGVNLAQLRRALDDHRHRARIRADVDAVGDAGARIGTPSFFIDDRLLQGAQPIEAFEAAIAEELRR